MAISVVETESIKASFRESMNLYPEAYPLSGNGPSDDAINSIVEWVDSSRDVEDDPEGTKIEWVEICVRCYVETLENDEDYLGENYEWCIDQAKHLMI